MNDALNKLKQESDQLKREVRERTIGYIVAALGLVAGLAWNDAIKALIEQIFPVGTDTIAVKFIYAIVITVVVVVVSINVLKFSRKDS